MELLLVMSNMKSRYEKGKLANLGRATISIVLGTLSGLITYALFLYFHIDIFGWNLGLIFAPLVAGYVETIIARKIIGESIGAISAFILFIVTVIYGFILANPTLGMNFITFGSIIVILQAALPTLINYFFLVVIISIISYSLGIFKKITDYTYLNIKRFYYHTILKEPMPVEVKVNEFYNEQKNNLKINNLDFYFFSMSNPLDKKIEKYLGPHESSVVFEKENNLISSEKEEEERELLIKFKKAKDQALINLCETIKADGGNGVLELSFEYEVIGLSDDLYQITAMGVGVKLR